MGAFYYVDNENAEEKELKVMDFVTNGSWNGHKLRSKLSNKLVKHILESVNILTASNEMTYHGELVNSYGNFTVESSWGY